MKEHYQSCTRCAMDTSAPNITFNEKGECNFCESLITRSQKRGDNTDKSLNEIVEKIKKEGKGKKYDCIVGVSGGADSSWMLVQSVKLGLRPLAVHMDNGWNSELSKQNISNLVNKLNVDLYTYAIDPKEYNEMLQAFFDADVIDIELLYDNAMLAVNYVCAKKHKVKYILSGSNQATEGIYMPKGWNWYKFDKKNIIDILKKNGKVKTKTFPYFSSFDYFRYEFIKRIKWCLLLDYMAYNKEEAMQNMHVNYGYQIYSHKHYESILTRFYQGYILPEKFGIDKRRLHYSTLIISGQLNREIALEKLKDSPYDTLETLQSDANFFLEKMEWTEDELNSYLKRNPVSHINYKSEKPLEEKIIRLTRKIEKILK